MISFSPDFINEEREAYRSKMSCSRAPLTSMGQGCLYSNVLCSVLNSFFETGHIKSQMKEIRISKK